MEEMDDVPTEPQAAQPPAAEPQVGDKRPRSEEEPEPTTIPSDPPVPSAPAPVTDPTAPQPEQPAQADVGLDPAPPAQPDTREQPAERPSDSGQNPGNAENPPSSQGPLERAAGPSAMRPPLPMGGRGPIAGRGRGGGGRIMGPAPRMQVVVQIESKIETTIVKAPSAKKSKSAAPGGGGSGLKSPKGDPKFEECRRGLLDLEEHIPWSLVRPSWKSLRSSWRKLLRSSVCTVQEMVQRMIELRDNLTFTDQDAAFCLRPDSPWGRLALRCTREVLPNGGKDESHALYIEMNAEVRQWMSARSRASTFKSARVVKTAARAIGAMEKAITSQGLAALQSVPLEHILSCDPNCLDAARELLLAERALIRIKMGLVGDRQPAVPAADTPEAAWESFRGLNFLRSNVLVHEGAAEAFGPSALVDLTAPPAGPEELEGEGPVAEALEEARRKEAAAAQQGEGARQGSDPTHAQ